MPTLRSRLFTALLTILIVLGVAVMVGLGFWQLDRLQQRRAANATARARLDQPPVEVTAETGALLEFQPVRLSGEYDFENEIVLRNRSHQQSPGVRVLTPLLLDGEGTGGTAVLVDRGWIPYTAAEPAVRAAYHRPAGPVTVEGIVRPAQPRTSALQPPDPTADPAVGRLDAWFRVDIERIQEQVPYRLLPFYVEAAPGPDPTLLPISGYEVDLSEGPHLGYAIQWFAFAAILGIGSLVVWRQSRRPQAAPPGLAGK